MLATKIFAYGVTHLTDARYFAAWEVDYLSFLIDPAVPGATTLDYVLAMREWIQGPEIVLSPNLDNLPGVTADAAGLTQLLVGPTAPLADLRVAGFTPHVLLPVAGYDSFDDVADRVREAHLHAGEVLLDFSAGGIEWQDLVDGRPFPADRLRELDVLPSISVAGFDPKILVEDYGLRGFAVRGSSEEKVGYKSFDELDDLFEGLEVFD